MHLDKCRGNKIKTLAASEHYSKNVLYPISQEYFHFKIFIQVHEKKISIQSTLRLRSDLTYIGLKDNLHENKYF